MYLITEEDVTRLRESLRNLPHVPADHLDDNYLRAFLNLNKGSIMAAAQNIGALCLRRFRLPHITVNLALHNGCAPLIMDQIVCVRLNKKLSSGASVQLYQMFEGTKNISTEELLKQMERISNMRFWEKQSSLEFPPYILIADFKNVTRKHIQSLDFSLLRKHLQFSVKSIRVESTHLVNVPEYASMLINLLANYLSAKLNSRLFIHSTCDTLFDYVPQEYLPSDYGGNDVSVKELNENQKSTVESMAKKFELDQAFWNQFISKNKSIKLSDEGGFIIENFRKLDFD